MTTWIAPTFYRTSALGSLPILAALDRIHPDHHTATLRAMRSVTQATAAWRLSLLSKFRLDALNLNRFKGSVLVVGVSGRPVATFRRGSPPISRQV